MSGEEGVVIKKICKQLGMFFLKKVTFISMLLFPVLSGVMTLLIFWRSTAKNKAIIMLIAGVAVISCLNATKVPESDLASYLGYYEELDGITFTDFFLRFGNEPIFYAFAWITGNITGFSDFLFAYFSSFLGCFLLSLGLFRILTLQFGVLPGPAVVVAFAVLLTPTIFSNSLHLIRQFIALALFFYGSSYIGLLRYLIWLVACLTHVSLAALVVFSLSGKGSGLLKATILGAVIFLVALRPFIESLGLSGSLGPISYLLQRAVQESFHQMDGLGLPHIIFVFVTGLLCVMPSRVAALRKFRVESAELRGSLLGVGGIVLMLTLIYDFNEPAARFFFYFVALAVPAFLMIGLKLFSNRLIFASVCMAVAVPPWVSLLLGGGTWSYAVSNPFIMLSPALNNVF